MLWQDEANNSPLHMIEASKTLFMDVVPLIYLEIIGSTFTYCAWKLDQFTHFLSHLQNIWLSEKNAALKTNQSPSLYTSKKCQGQ